jgi:mannosyltransferase
MLAATLLSVFFFSDQSLRLDEAQSLWQTGRSPGDILTIVAQDVHVPLYHEALHFWRLYIGDSVAVARGFSLLFYLLSIPALYFLGKLAYSRGAGLFAATLLTVSPFMNWYGGEIRMYTLFVFLVIINQYCYLRLWRTSPITTAESEHVWVVYILTALLGVYTHYFFFLLLGVQTIYFLLRQGLFLPRTMQRMVLMWGLVVASIIPWALYVLMQGQAVNASPFLPTPTTVNLFSAFSQFFFGFQNDHLNTVVLSLWPVIFLLVILALRTSTKLAPHTEYFVLSVVIPVSVVFAASFVLPLFVSRYLIFTVPALYLLAAALFSSYPVPAARIARRALVAAMVVMLAVEMASSTVPVKENYREAAVYLTNAAKAQDVIALSAPFTVYPIEYYYRGEAELITLPLWDRYAYGPIPVFDKARLAEEVTATTEGHQTVWLLLSYDQGYEKEVKLYFDTNFERTTEVNFSPGLNLYGYKIRYDTPLASAE